MVDPATQLFNRRAIDDILTQEVSRANRMGTNLTALMLKLESLQVVNGRYGAAAGDQFLVEVAKLLKVTFRGSDTLSRYSGTEFLVIMPGTSEQQAECAIRRLQEAVDQWNVTTKTGWEINLIHGLATHVSGSEASDLLRTVERKCQPHREKLVPVFLPVPSANGESSHVIV
jgi:diguanylate cyclase (GGDEF)-like protein